MSSPSPKERDSGPPRELLDVEDEDARQQRIQSLLESTDVGSHPRSGPTLPPLHPATKPHPVPQSDLISRAEAFLPRLAASNADLAQRAAADPASVDIENLGEAGDEAPHIELSLGLGVFEQKPKRSSAQSPSTAKRTSTSSSSQDPSPTLRSPATGVSVSTAPTTLDEAHGSSSASSSDDETSSGDEDEDSDEDSDSEGSVISVIPPDEARALEALLSPRPLGVLSPTLQQQQQQQPQADDHAKGPAQPSAAGAGTKRPNIVVLTSELDIDMDTGPQTARGWEEE